MKAPLIAVLSLGILSAAPAASASLDETLDLSGHVTHVRQGAVATGAPGFEATGLSLRAGISDHAFRYGAALGVASPPMHALWVNAEAFVAYAPNGYENVRPYVELRAHADRLHRLEAADGASLTRYGVGPRVGVLMPLSEYCFLDLGIGRDVIGSEELRATIGLGLPIPLSHL